ncbi:hypothetical protein K5I29_04470 [Flavobacterium agricola]|uniref:Uncharacterized protein n=1 Tax=Flavobacterium agricola TaxID=2870839 RepID=A0ABY6M1N9_9FLAO|nr:hypothetical protein [Flavobacterium agricola]UYW02162.1 hypothetical protein K5I29_04470 [Flavobacterium agricola]
MNVTKNFFLKKNIRKKKHVIPASNKAVLVVLNVYAITNLQQLETELKNSILKNYTVTFVYFDADKKEEDASNPNYITQKSFNWKAQLINTQTKALLKQEYKLCICFSPSNKYVNKIINGVPASYKFEITDQRNDIFDVSLISSTATYADQLPALQKILKSFNLIS